MLFAVAFLGSVVGGSINLRLALVLPMLIAWYIHATTVNDFSDYQIDKINLKFEKDRPLLRGSLAPAALWRIHFASLLVVMILSLSFGIKAVILTICLLTTNYLYSIRPFRMSDRGIAAQFLLSFSYTYYPLVLGYWASSSSASFPWVLSLGLFNAFMARLLLKDFRDVKGDRTHGKLTFLLRHGPHHTVLASSAFWVVAVGFIGQYALFAVALIIPLLIGLAEIGLFLRILIKTKDVFEQQLVITFIAKTANALIITLLAFLLSRNQGMISELERTLIPSILGGGLLAFNWVRYFLYQRIVTLPLSASISTN
jgi:4-hydroxybenzoate polyprenyltransferase